MTTKPENTTDEEFDFDLALDEHQNTSNEHSDPLTADDGLLDAGPLESNTVAQKKSGKALFVIGGIFLSLLFLLLIFISYAVLTSSADEAVKPSGASRTGQITDSGSLNVNGSDGAAGFESSGSLQETNRPTQQVDGFGNNVSTDMNNWDRQVEQSIQQDSPEQNIPHSYSVPTDSNPIVITDGFSEVTSTNDGLSLTAEEREFDKLLDQTSQIDELPEGMVIDQAVVRTNVQARKISEIEDEISSMRSTNEQFLEAVTGMSHQVEQIALAVKESNANHDALSETVKELSEKVDGVNSIIEASEQLANRIKVVELAQEKQQALGSTAATSSPVARQTITVASAQTRQAERRQETTQVAQAAPKPVERQVAAAPVRQQAPARTQTPVVAAASSKPANVTPPADQCAGKPSSQVWRVKGVNQTSAYITRPQDRNGFIVRQGVEIPGFGRVLGFNPSARQVCTTSGLIGR
tara:strand:+ start:385 stop:1785 length:1401 start_codon:yes stop_codon:yes gene_type:complete